MKKFLLILSNITIGFAMGGLLVKKFDKKDANKKNVFINKRLEKYYDLLLNWMKYKNQGWSIEEFFECRGYSKIAIYGMGKLGETLYDELKKSKKVEVLYAVDAADEKRTEDLKIYHMIDIKDLEQPDVVVVTPIYDYNDICKEVKKYFKCAVVSLENVVYEE